MGWGTLLVAALLRRPIRSLLVGLSAMTAFLLLGVLSGVLVALDQITSDLDDQRIRVVSRLGFGELLPAAHAKTMTELDQVEHATTLLAFPGYFQDRANGFGGAAVHFTSFLEVFDQFNITAEERADLVSVRNSATVGAVLSRRYNWQVGDEVPLTSTYLTNKQGSLVWPVKIVAIHNPDPDDDRIQANEIYINLDYVEEFRAADAGTAHMFAISIKDGAEVGATIATIDAAFQNSSAPTSSFPENEFFTSRLEQIGDIPGVIRGILVAVFIALLLVTTSSMFHSTPERRAEFGVLFSMGFSRSQVCILTFLESAILLGVAALLGLSIASILFPPLFQRIATGETYLSLETWGIGLSAAVLIASLVTLRPIWFLAREQPAELLSKG